MTTTSIKNIAHTSQDGDYHPSTCSKTIIALAKYALHKGDHPANYLGFRYTMISNNFKNLF